MSLNSVPASPSPKANVDGHETGAARASAARDLASVRDAENAATLKEGNRKRAAAQRTVNTYKARAAQAARQNVLKVPGTRI
jgi:hypothetical protein